MAVRITAIGEILFDIYPNHKKLGGAPFNFAHHTWKLTGSAAFVSRVGEDKEGEETLQYLQKKNFDTSYIQIDKLHPTGAVYVKLDENKVPAYNIAENRAYDFIELNNNLEQLVSEKTSLLYFGTLALRNEATRKTVEKLLENNLKYFCDVNLRQNFYSAELLHNCLSRSNVVKLNEDELQIVNKQLIQKEFNLKKTPLDIIEKYNIDILCVTLGSDGAYLFTSNEESRYKEKVDNIVDTVGAGDAYASILAIGYLNNWELDEINKTASEFAAAVCMIEGAIPDGDDLYNKFREKTDNE